MVRRITIAALAAALAGAVLAVPALSANGPQAVAAKKAKKKCKKAKKGTKSKKKRKGCKKAGGGYSGAGLPGQATPSSPSQPDHPTTPSAHVSSVSLATNPVFAGNSTSGTVHIDGPAPAGGQPVGLTSSAPSVTVPASVVVPAGATSASFSVDTTPSVAATSTLTGSIDTSTASIQLSVVDTASVSSVQLERQCFTFGPFSSNRVSLDVPAPADTSVSLASSDDTFLTVPPSVTVPSGSTSAFFGVNAIAATPSVTVIATLDSSQASDDASVSATDPATHADGLSVDPDTVIAGNGSTGTVTLDCEAPPGGTTVTLSSADPGVTFDATGTQSATVNVPQGQLSADFSISTNGTLDDGQYDVSATVGADTPVHATLTIDSSLPT